MRLFKLIPLLLLVLFVGARPAQASTQDFVIHAFDADYYLSRDANRVSEMKVDERIVAEFPDFNQNHGILRAIPKSYQNHSLEVTVLAVTDAVGKKLHYESYTENDNLVLKIGDADTYVHGVQQYNIGYTLRGVVQPLGDHDELYWDINGDQWSQTFEQVTARVHMPNDLFQQLNGHRTCYSGFFGSVQSSCTITDDGHDTVTTVTTHSLNASQTLTVVLAFAPGTFAGYQPSAGQIMHWVLMGLAVAAPVVLAGVVVLIGWRRKGRDAPARHAIVPEYLPPAGVSVLASNAVLAEKFESKAVSATIVDLAVRHYIKIYEDKKSYRLELVKEPKGLNVDDRAVLVMLFGERPVGAIVDMEPLRQTLGSKSESLGQAVGKRVTKAGYFAADPNKARQPWQIFGGILFVVGFFAPPISLGVSAAGALLFIGAWVMPARTAKGVELRNYLLGMRDYMKLAEADRIKLLQSPHGELTEKIDVANKGQLIKLYERLLPYAILFGIEKQWMKQFADLYEQPPDWYVGDYYGPYGLGHFVSASSVTFNPPSSSSGSGFSGGAGGGGGGGGGGGW